MSTFSIAYDPTTKLECRCGNRVDAVHIEVEDRPVCSFCAPDVPAFADLADSLDDLDGVLALAPDNLRGMLAEDAFRMLAAIVDARVPDGHGADPLLPDDAFVAELLRRAAALEVDRDKILAIVGALVPGFSMKTFGAIVDRLREQAAAASARGTAEAAQMQAAVLLLSRAPAGSTVAGAVERLGLDFDRFTGAALTAAASRGVAVTDLPPDLVNDLITASKKGNS
ncbi:hypothetical protein ACN26Y_29920 [Micromonospora sp. WMMD558]|uniref:hypothetical protein n=1 Tax=Micromonospora sp. WMMD558 TaxID=3403462 RepID=UPI003BF4F661